MKIGVNLHNHGPFASKPAIDALALRAEALGYDSIWTADHILVPRTEPEPFGQLLETLTTLSYVAAKTDRIALGTSILVLPQREPILVAKQAATVHELSGPSAPPPASRTDGTPWMPARRRSATTRRRWPRSPRTDRSTSRCASGQPSAEQPDPHPPQPTQTTEHSRVSRT
jgi:hypothetical protein